MTQSIRYQIASTLYAALQAAPALGALAGPPARAAAKLRRNPRAPASAADGQRIVEFEEQVDSPTGDRNSQQGKRLFVFELRTMARAGDADAGADADYVAAAAALRSAFPAVSSLLRGLGGIPVALREQQVRFTVDDMDVDGALVEGTWEVEYLEPKLAR